MRRRAILPILVPFVAFVASCSPTPTDRSLVVDLRVLGIRTEPPEAAPGSTVRVDALIADPKGEGRPLTEVWGLCTPDFVKGISSCLEAGRTVPLALAGTSFSFTLDPNTLDGVPPETQAQGIDLFLVLDVKAAAITGQPGAETTAFKRVRVSTSPTPNHNPRLLEFRVDGVDADRSVDPGQTVLLEAAVTPASFESYVDPVTGETSKEDVKFSWFATAGEFGDKISLQDPDGGVRNLWTADKGAPPATLWVVIRDRRGGVDWLRRDVTP